MFTKSILTASALVGLSLAIGGTSAAFAKGHDLGLADDSQIDPSGFSAVAPGNLNATGSRVSGNDLDGVGEIQGEFVGVSADGDLTYGQVIIVPLVERDGVRQIPQDNPDGFPPGQ